MDYNAGEKERKKYEFLYHIADAKFRAYGSTMEEAFENAALAMFNVMIIPFLHFSVSLRMLDPCLNMVYFFFPCHEDGYIKSKVSGLHNRTNLG